MIPPEIWKIVFSFIQLPTLFLYCQVSKEWNTWINELSHKYLFGIPKPLIKEKSNVKEYFHQLYCEKSQDHPKVIYLENMNWGYGSYVPLIFSHFSSNCLIYTNTKTRKITKYNTEIQQSIDLVDFGSLIEKLMFFQNNDQLIVKTNGIIILLPFNNQLPSLIRDGFNMSIEDKTYHSIDECSIYTLKLNNDVFDIWCFDYGKQPFKDQMWNLKTKGLSISNMKFFTKFFASCDKNAYVLFHPDPTKNNNDMLFVFNYETNTSSKITFPLKYSFVNGPVTRTYLFILNKQPFVFVLTPDGDCKLIKIFTSKKKTVCLDIQVGGVKTQKKSYIAIAHHVTQNFLFMRLSFLTPKGLCQVLIVRIPLGQVFGYYKPSNEYEPKVDGVITESLKLEKIYYMCKLSVHVDFYRDFVSYKKGITKSGRHIQHEIDQNDSINQIIKIV